MLSSQQLLRLFTSLNQLLIRQDKGRKRDTRIILDATFLARTLSLFLELGRPLINQIYIERRLFLLDGLGLVTFLRNCNL